MTIFIISFLVGVNCFMAGYQYSKYREKRKRGWDDDLLKRIEENDPVIMDRVADKIMEYLCIKQKS